MYLLGAVYASIEEQWDMAVLLVCTFLATLAYHTSREARYFNVDFIFAMSVALIYWWTMYNATPPEYWEAMYFSPGLDNNHQVCQPEELTFYLGVMGLPLCVFLFALCGAPAEIVAIDKNDLGQKISVGCLCRRDSAIYNAVHPIWHIVSGIGPFWMVRYFRYYCAQDAGLVFGARDWTLAQGPLSEIVAALGLGSILRVPAVFTVVVSTAIGLNLLGNSLGVFPVF